MNVYSALPNRSINDIINQSMNFCAATVINSWCRWRTKSNPSRSIRQTRGFQGCNALNFKRRLESKTGASIGSNSKAKFPEVEPVGEMGDVKEAIIFRLVPIGTRVVWLRPKVSQKIASISPGHFRSAEVCSKMLELIGRRTWRRMKDDDLWPLRGSFDLCSDSSYY